MAAPGSFQEAELYEVVGNVYGLANAPFLFSKVVRSKMKRLGFVEHSLDCMLFLFYENSELIAIACFHVDDMLLACAPSYDLNRLKDAFTWGPWSSLRQCSLKFTGHQFRLRNEDIIVHQQEFTLSTPTKRLRVGPATDRLLQSAEEYSEYRSCGGSLQWLSGHSRPDCSATTSLSQRDDPKLSDLAAMYETIEHARASSADGFCISSLDLKKLCTVAYGDSSFANAPGCKTQQGHVTTLTETTCTTRETRASIVDWRSGRAHRVVRSTLAGEAAACDNAADSGVYTARFMAEVVHGRQRAR